MSKLLIIGCGGVARVAIAKCCQNSEVFTEICIASRTVSKCNDLKAELEGTTETKITTAQVDADDVAAVTALIEEYGPDAVLNVALPYQDLSIMDACLAAGGRVISVVADELTRNNGTENMLYISEEGYDEPFSTLRALSRNRVIHTLGRMVFVAQSSLEKGGTWDGTAKNLHFGWSPVACFRDGSRL